jgi:hypothetical protein
MGQARAAGELGSASRSLLNLGCKAGGRAPFQVSTVWSTAYQAKTNSSSSTSSSAAITINREHDEAHAGTPARFARFTSALK